MADIKISTEISIWVSWSDFVVVEYICGIGRYVDVDYVAISAVNLYSKGLYF